MIYHNNAELDAELEPELMETAPGESTEAPAGLGASDGPCEPSDIELPNESDVEAGPRDVVPAVPATLLPDFTEMGNAERLIDRFGIDLKYCRDDDKTPWRFWNGRYWDKDKGE